MMAAGRDFLFLERGDVVTVLLAIEAVSRLEACLPDGLDTLAEVIEDVASLDTTTSRQEATHDARDVTTDVERLRIINTDALYPKTETSDAWKNNGQTFRKPMLQDVLKFCYHTIHGPFRESAVATGFSCYFTERYLALTDCFRKIFSIRTATLNIVLDKSNMYCHFE